MEADNIIAELERDYLEADGFEVKILSDGRAITEEVRTGQYTALLLDVMLPNKNGFEICREVRRDFNIPILLISAKHDDVDKIRGLGLGADDYILKPFSPPELLARQLL